MTYISPGQREQLAVLLISHGFETRAKFADYRPDHMDQWLESADQFLASDWLASVLDMARCEERARLNHCPTLCDPECARMCHEVHALPWKRGHDPEQCRAAQLEHARREGAEKAWDEGYAAGHSRAMRRMSDEPDVAPAPNPYRDGAQ